MIKKLKRIPYRLNRQRFNEDNSCITNLKLVADVRTYFQYVNDTQRLQLRDKIIKNLPTDNSIINEKVIAHAYWYGKIGRKQAFSILSYLATQDLTRTEVWLWLDEENGYSGYEQNPYLRELLPYINVKKYNPNKELKGLTYFNKIIFTETSNLAYRADGFRILVLYKYGGLYFDLDVCFLENILCLCTRDAWCYAWEKQAYANNALLYFPKNAKPDIIKYLFWKAQIKAPMPWAILSYTDRKLRNLVLYPYWLFDPAWISKNNEATDELFDSFFLPANNDSCNAAERITPYPGAIAYHWHNRWDMAVSENSYFSILEKAYRQKLNL